MLEIKQITKGDLHDIALIRCEDNNQLLRYIDGSCHSKLLEDYFLFFLKAIPSVFMGCFEGGNLVGYIAISTTDRNILTQAFIKGYLLRWAINWITGKYSIGFKSVVKAIKRFMQNPWFKRKDTLGPLPYIVSIATAPSYKRRGIALALLEKGCESLKIEGHSKLSIHVGIENKEPLNLFLKNGFRITGKTPHFYSMIKELD